MMGFVYFNFPFFFLRCASRLLVGRGLEPYLYVSFFFFSCASQWCSCWGLKPFCVRYIFHFKFDNYIVVGGGPFSPYVSEGMGGHTGKIIN
jgi:hypothetical protein